MKITIIGTGYVGLVTGVCLAFKGHNVTCVDRNSSIVNKLNSGKPTIYEKNLEKILKFVIRNKKFYVSSNLKKSLNYSSVVMIAVGTPSVNGKINLNDILNVSTEIGKFIKTSNKYISVIIKSTVTPGTTDGLILNEIEKISGKKLGQFGLGMNPEFLREGNAIDDFMFPDRIVLGFEDKKTLQYLEKLYSFTKANKIKVNSRTAELIKYTSNFLLATQISSINEIANLAFKLGKINIKKVLNGVHLDKRWNPIVKKKRINPEILNYLVPGCGFGGSCFTKDVEAIKTQGMKLGLPMKIMNATLAVNHNQPSQTVKILESQINKLSKCSILLLGLSFKAGTDDVRDSPSLKIAKELMKKKMKIYAHDPIAAKNFKKAFGKNSKNIRFVKKWINILNKVNVIMIVTPWEEYFSLSKLKFNNQIIFDVRCAFSKENFKGSKYLTT